MGVNIVKDYVAYCPLLKRKIDDGLCYEIELVLWQNAMKSLVPELKNKDWDKARKIWPACHPEFKQE